MPRDINVNLKMSVPENLSNKDIANAIQQLLAKKLQAGTLHDVTVYDRTDAMKRSEQLRTQAENLVADIARREANNPVTIDGNAVDCGIALPSE